MVLAMVPSTAGWWFPGGCAYLRLWIVLTAISTSPSLASLSGNSRMLWIAFSA